MLRLYSQHRWNSLDDAILHHLPLTENFDQDLGYKMGVSYIRFLGY